MIVLAYLWPLAIIPLLLETHDQQVRWHAKHGLLLMAAELVVFFLVTLLIAAIGRASLSLGCVLSLGVVFAWVAVLVLHIAAIVKGINGGRLPVPGISHLADRL